MPFLLLVINGIFLIFVSHRISKEIAGKMLKINHCKFGGFEIYKFIRYCYIGGCKRSSIPGGTTFKKEKSRKHLNFKEV